MENQTVVSTMFWPWIAGNLSVVSIPLSHGKSNRCFNNVLASSCKQSRRRFNSFLKCKISPLFQQFTGVRLQVIYPLCQIFCQMWNFAVISTLFWLCTVGNRSLFLNFFLNWKIKPLSQQCFGLGLRAISSLFQFLCHMENLTVLSTMFRLLLVGNLSVVSILFSKEKSNRCCNSF